MPSKSARKRELLTLQAMGEQLIELDRSHLEKMPLDESLRAAIDEAKRIRSRSALRRQRQLIGRLMREADAEAIRTTLEEIGRQDRQATEAFHAAERWRDQIASEGAPALAEFIALTQRPSRTLERLLRDHESAVSEAAKRTLRRRMFREVRDELDQARPEAGRTSDPETEANE